MQTRPGKYRLPLAIFLIIAPSISWAQTYSFQQCVETTLSQNPAMAASGYRLQQAESALSESNAQRMPKITLAAQAVNSNDALNVFGMKLQQREASFNDFGFNEFNPASPDPTTQPKDLNQPDAHSNFNTSLEVLIPVWNGGKISSYQDQAKAMIQAAQHGDEAVKQVLTFNVYKAFEGVHTAKAFVKVAEQALKASKAYVNTTENLLKQGVVVKSELLSAQVNLSQSLTSYEAAKTQKLIAKDNLRSLMNLDPNADFKVGERQNISLPADDLAELTSLSTSSNPAIKATREAARSSTAAIAASKAANYPSFNLMARGDTHDPSLGFGSTSYTVAGVVSWKLTDFGVTSSKVDRAQALANEQKSTLRSKESQSRLEVLKSWRMLKVAESQFSSNKLAVSQAEEAQRLVLKRHKGGVATITEILASQAQLDKSRADLVRSQYEINLQKAKLRLATGSMKHQQL